VPRRKVGRYIICSLWIAGVFWTTVGNAHVCAQLLFYRVKCDPYSDRIGVKIDQNDPFPGQFSIFNFLPFGIGITNNISSNNDKGGDALRPLSKQMHGGIVDKKLEKCRGKFPNTGSWKIRKNGFFPVPFSPTLLLLSNIQNLKLLKLATNCQKLSEHAV
jgi:hypothetical protein